MEVLSGTLTRVVHSWKVIFALIAVVLVMFEYQAAHTCPCALGVVVCRAGYVWRHVGVYVHFFQDTAWKRVSATFRFMLYLLLNPSWFLGRRQKLWLPLSVLWASFTWAFTAWNSLYFGINCYPFSFMSKLGHFVDLKKCMQRSVLLPVDIISAS